MANLPDKPKRLPTRTVGFASNVAGPGTVGSGLPRNGDAGTRSGYENEVT